MLYIRVDGNAVIGVGHVMRCLSVAEAARKRKIAVTFLLADDRAGQLIRDRGYDALVLGTDYRSMEAELPLLCGLLAPQQETERQETGQQAAGRQETERLESGGEGVREGNMLLVDSYFATQRYLEALHRVLPVAYLDDFGSTRFGVDLIINYNIYAPKLGYDALYEAAAHKPALLLGSRYAPLREDFRHARYAVRERAGQILVMTGGADGCRAAMKIAKRLLPLKEVVTIHLVSGPFHTFREELRVLAAQHNKLAVHENVTDMAALMETCDIAVSAAGSTLYELCAVGVPTIYFYFVDNQRLPAQHFAQDTNMLNTGNFVENEDETLDNIVSETAKMLRSVEWRREVSASMRTVADGEGADRIAEKLQSYMEKQSGEAV